MGRLLTILHRARVLDFIGAYLLLQTGDVLLTETGDKMIVE